MVPLLPGGAVSPSPPLFDPVAGPDVLRVRLDADAELPAPLLGAVADLPGLAGGADPDLPGDAGVECCADAGSAALRIRAVANVVAAAARPAIRAQRACIEPPIRRRAIPRSAAALAVRMCGFTFRQDPSQT